APLSLTLSGDAPRQQLLVSATAEREIDATHNSKFSSGDPSIALVDAAGLVTGIKDGETVIRVTVKDQTREVPVRVQQIAVRRPLDFERDVQPLFTRHACNSGPCHGKQRGQNGFQLSLLGFDSDFD